MEPISIAQLEAFLSGAGIVVAGANLRIGRELTYIKRPLRTVIVQLGGSDTNDYVSTVISIIIQAEMEWLLTPRYGAASGLGIIKSVNNLSAILFKASERHKLVEYLCTRSMDMGGVSSDIYVLSSGGNVLLTWDHHTATEGLRIELCRVDQAGQLLVALNKIGAILEVYYSER